MIEVKELRKRFGSRETVKGISFVARQGRVLGFLGPNGAGKTTTMRMLTGYLSPDSGTIVIDGLDMALKGQEARKRIGYLPENNPLYTGMYVKEALDFVAGLYKLPRKAQRIKEVIAMTGIGPEQHKKIGQLSKGYRQRVGLAQAIIHDPDVLILDEPSSGLDPNQQLDIRKLINDLGQTRTIILSTHIMQEVEAVCADVVILHEGNIVADFGMENRHQLFPGLTLEDIFVERSK